MEAPPTDSTDLLLTMRPKSGVTDNELSLKLKEAEDFVASTFFGVFKVDGPGCRLERLQVNYPYSAGIRYTVYLCNP